MSEHLKEGYLTGKLLLAMPNMGDPRFHRSVIYMTNHDENGAMGLVINHAIPSVEFKDILKQLPFKSDIEIDPAALSVPIMLGGPVEAGRGFLLHSSEFSQKQTVSVDDYVSVTATIDALQEIAKGKGPQERMLILGYAGWEAGQLDAEIQNNSWLVADADSGLIFDVPHEEKWQAAVASLGFDPGMLVGDAGKA